MNKLTLACALAASMVLAGCATQQAADTAVAAGGAYKDGTYIGQGTGNASVMDVEVVVAGGKVTSVKVIKHDETEMLLRAAEKRVAKNVIAANGTEGVQTLTGATNSSKGIIEAVNKALAQAK